jgi:hypothetical protein
MDISADAYMNEPVRYPALQVIDLKEGISSARRLDNVLGVSSRRAEEIRLKVVVISSGEIAGSEDDGEAQCSRSLTE